MGHVLGADEDDEVDDQTVQDRINAAIESRKPLKNASYFAFPATPKHKTLQLFGTPIIEGGEIRRTPFHIYSMKQAIEEKFILDVLQSYKGDRQKIEIESNNALQQVMGDYVSDQTDLYKHFADDPGVPHVHFADGSSVALSVGVEDTSP
jgi:hypothetical protein